MNASCLKKTSRAALLVCALATAGAAQAITWDLAADYQLDGNNPEGAWTYGWEQTLNSALNLYDTFVGTQWTASQHHSGDGTPTVWKNTSGGLIYGVPTGQVALHPGWDNSFSVARWTSPVAAEITVTGSFLSGDMGAESDYIALNGVVVQQWLSNGNDVSFSFQFTASPGDTVDFIVGVPIGRDYGFGTTPVLATLTAAVPEPGTGALWLAGMAAGLAIRRRRRGA